MQHRWRLQGLLGTHISIIEAQGGENSAEEVSLGRTANATPKAGMKNKNHV